jgi:hypothetical protein
MSLDGNLRNNFLTGPRVVRDNTHTELYEQDQGTGNRAMRSPA